MTANVITKTNLINPNVNIGGIWMDNYMYQVKTEPVAMENQRLTNW